MQQTHELASYNSEPVMSQPGLDDCEQETAIYFSARSAKQGYVENSSNHSPIVRGLLQHVDYIPDEITAATGSLSVGEAITQSARSTGRSSHEASRLSLVEQEVGV